MRRTDLTAKARILVVDDEADVARYVAAALEDAGYEVIVAADAKEGLDRLRDGSPDLLCLDLVMPGRTGISLYREIREDPEYTNVPIVVVTGVTEADAKARLGLGSALPEPEGFVEKPLDVGRLLRIVDSLLPVGGS